MSLLQDKVVLISGGTQGMGGAVARAAAEAGATVVVSGRREDVGTAFATALEEKVGREVVYVAADVGDVEQAQASVHEVVRRFGRIDSLVNAAGFTNRGSLLDTTPELFDQHVAVNLRGPFFLMQAAVQDMVSRGAPGTIVNITTMTAHGGQPYLSPYAATKAGLVGLTRNAAHAHRWDRIRVNAVNIGWTQTEGEDVTQRQFHSAGDDWLEQAAENLPMGQLGQPDDAAALVVLLLSERSGVVTGSVIDWDQHVVGGLD